MDPLNRSAGIVVRSRNSDERRTRRERKLLSSRVENRCARSQDRLLEAVYAERDVRYPRWYPIRDRWGGSGYGVSFRVELCTTCSCRTFDFALPTDVSETYPRCVLGMVASQE